MTWLNQLPDAEGWQARLTQLGLPLDLDDWPYRPDSPIGPWKVSPCCGAFVEWSAADGSGAGGDLLTCKRCYQAVPEGFVDEPPRLGDEPPRPPSEPFKLRIMLPPHCRAHLEARSDCPDCERERL